MNRIREAVLDINEYKAGDFVEWSPYGNGIEVGIAVEVPSRGDKKRITIAGFDMGRPSAERHNPQHGRVRKIPQEACIAKLYQQIQIFDEGMDQGGLEGAIAAWRRFQLRSVINGIEGRQKSDIARIVNDRVNSSQDVNTGVYVAVGFYSDSGSNYNHKQGIVIEPRIPEKTLVNLLRELYPEGLGDIPQRETSTLGKPTRKLSTYTVFEIPTYAIEMVDNPLRLELERAA
jgi:hypothetical protein